MKERPIIFSSEMVRAILEGRKTQTRRPIRISGGFLNRSFRIREGINIWIIEDDHDFLPRYQEYLKCPYGQPGSSFWVRETWAMIYTGEGCLHSEDEIRCPCEGCHIEYRADTDAKYPGEWDTEEAKDNDDAPKWHSSRFMFHWASRITLEIINIRAEKVQEITEKDAKAEGIEGVSCPPIGILYMPAFSRLWDSIYSKKGLAWNQNPWVWVIEFKRIDNAKRT